MWICLWKHPVFAPKISTGVKTHSSCFYSSDDARAWYCIKPGLRYYSFGIFSTYLHIYNTQGVKSSQTKDGWKAFWDFFYSCAPVFIDWICSPSKFGLVLNSFNWWSVKEQTFCLTWLQLQCSFHFHQEYFNLQFAIQTRLVIKLGPNNLLNWIPNRKQKWFVF